MTSLGRVATAVRRLEDGLLVSLLLSLLLLAVTQIVLRNLANSGLPWADPLLRTGVLWLALLGAGIAARSHRHITIDLLTRSLPPAPRLVLQRLIFLVTAGVCGLVAWHSLRFVQAEYEFASSWILGLESWVPPLILPIGFAIIALRYAAHGLGLTTPEA